MLDDNCEGFQLDGYKMKLFPDITEGVAVFLLILRIMKQTENRPFEVRLALLTRKPILSNYMSIVVIRVKLGKQEPNRT